MVCLRPSGGGAYRTQNSNGPDGWGRCRYQGPGNPLGRQDHREPESLTQAPQTTQTPFSEAIEKEKGKP